MSVSPRRQISAALAVALICACGTGGPSDGVPPPDPLETALEAAARYLTSRQSTDGGWRSDVYGVLGDDPALTAHVASALYFIAPAEGKARAAFERGARLLATSAPRIAFPVYTAAEASWVTALAGDHAARDRWLALVRELQLDARWGWTSADPALGGWGYAAGRPLRPAASANVSATVFALGALRSAHVPADDPAFANALGFIERCQNFAPTDETSDPAFDDGGFFFAPGDPAGSKAGPAGVDRHGRERLHSYGSATADGLRVLLACGLGPDHPRVLAARGWLERHFAADTNPGRFNPDREALRDATYYYWTWSVSHAFARLGLEEIDTPAGRVRWTDALAAELLRRQRSDGSWANPYTDSKEDDPLVATPFAAATLAVCREAGAGGRGVEARR